MNLKSFILNIFIPCFLFLVIFSFMFVSVTESFADACIRLGWDGHSFHKTGNVCYKNMTFDNETMIVYSSSTNPQNLKSPYNLLEVKL